MIQFKSLRQYTHVVDSIMFPQNPNEPFLFVYFPENSTFLADRPKMKFRIQDFRLVVVPTTKVPRSRLTNDMRQLYRQYKLIAYPMQMKIPEGYNVIVDLSGYLKAIDTIFKPSNYRQRAGFLVQDAVNRAFNKFPNNYQKILVYSVNITKDMNQFVNRKIFGFLKQWKDEEFPFDHLLLQLVGETGTRFRLLVKDRDFNFSRVRFFLKQIKPIDVEEETEKQSGEAASQVVDNVKDQLPEDKISATKDAVEDYLEQNPETLEKIATGQASEEDMAKIATASILYQTNQDIIKSDRIASSISPDRSTKALKAVSKAYQDDLLTPEKTVSSSTEPAIEMYNPTKLVDNKSPEHIFQKRKLDFDTNLKKDMTNAFKVLESKEIPLKVNNISVADKPKKAGELEPSDLSIITVQLTDKFGNKHSVEIEIPKIDPATGTFRLNGRTKCLINQIVQKPITFPKAGESRFESSYSIFRIYTKQLRQEKYLESFMVYRLPFLILLSFAFGFEETLKLYGVKYEITEEKPPKTEKFWSEIPSSYIVFKNINSDLKEQLCKSFVRANVSAYNVEGEFGTRQYFENLIIQMTGRLNSTFQISSSLQNIVDPVAKQVLRADQLPTDLPLIMKYMAEKVVARYVIDRNDLTNQRIRNSEVLVALAQKQILSAYTTYKEQVLSGNEKANFTMSSTKVLADFQKTELVVDIEYANPVEEMATKTRVSPVGKVVGGIPDKRAIQTQARNVHPSYFGNIDPLDTPEGENIGIVQQLTIDAHVSAGRGLFGVKNISNDEKSGMLSTSTAMVPFLENNEGARVIMISQQAKQSVPLKNPEPPIVQSGYESVLTNVVSDNFIKRAPCTGKIEKISDEEIKLVCKEGKKQSVDITPVHLRSGSGKNTLSVFNPTVKEGQSVKVGNIIAEGSCISKGTISLGRTLAVAVMPYKGYNFEDSIVINEKLVEEDKLTSLHGIEEEVLIDRKDRLLYIAKKGETIEKGEPLLRKTIGELEELIGFNEEDEGSEIVGQQYIQKSPGGKIVDIEVFSNVRKGAFPDLEPLIEKTVKKYGKPPQEKFSVRGNTIQGILIKFKIQQELPIEASDKLCNRYGNKGIISLVEKNENMPRTPFGDRIDIIINPIGILGRMNMGQVYELYCGLISRALGSRLSKITSKSQALAMLKAALPKLDNTKNQEASSIFLSNLSKLPPAKFKQFMEEITKTGFFPIVVPPFKGPNYKNILVTLKALGLKTGYKLFLPEFNTKTANDVPVGYMYMYKLEHMGAGKIYGRSTGPTTAKTGQPTAGKRKEGGQRIGELDSYSFISYNCPNLLAEFMGPLSDDFITKDEIIADIIQNGNADYRPAKISPAKDLLNAYFVSLMLER